MPDDHRAIYAIIIGLAAVPLYSAVGRLDPNGPFGRVLQLLVLVAAAAAIIHTVLP